MTKSKNIELNKATSKRIKGNTNARVNRIGQLNTGLPRTLIVLNFKNTINTRIRNK